MKFQITDDYKKAFRGMLIYFIVSVIFFPLYHLIKGDFSWGDTLSYVILSLIVAVVVAVFFFFGFQIPKND